MIAVFSCAAYKNFDEVKQLCIEAESAVNNSLMEKEYLGIQFLNPQFSFISIVEEIPPTIDDATLSLIVAVEKADLPHIASALIRGLDSPLVPEMLMQDLRITFERKGWL